MARFSCAAVLLSLVTALGAAAPACAAGSMEYGSALLVVDGVINATPARDRFTMTDVSGDTYDVRVEPGKTFVASPDVIRVGHPVQVYGHATGRGSSLVAEEVDPRGPQAFTDDDKKRNGTLKYVLGAAAGVLVGGGLYGLSHGWFHGTGTQPATAAQSVPASVQFGGGQ